MTVGLDERITVGLDESVMTVLPVTVNGPSVDRATTRAGMVDVTVLDPATT
jgi:hypothetical protein